MIKEAHTSPGLSGSDRQFTRRALVRRLESGRYPAARPGREVCFLVLDASAVSEATSMRTFGVHQ
jgi:hypothetical protein